MEDITKYISNLQAFADAEIMGASMQFSHFSISECENLIKGISRYIIDIIVSSKKQNSDLLTYILPLLTMTRFDEVINNLGNMGKLEDVIGISITPKKSNDYFTELLLENFKIAKNIKQKGGTKCNDDCDTNDDCDNECPTCLNSKCVSNSNQDVPINNNLAAVLHDGSIVKTPNVVSNLSTEEATKAVIAGTVSDIALVIGANTEIFNNTLNATLELPKRLEQHATHFMKVLEKDVNTAINRTKEALIDLNKYTEGAEEVNKEEFDKIYQAYKADLRLREFIETTAGQTSAVISLISSVKFANIALDVLNVFKRGLVNGVAWTGLSIVKILSGIPFIAILPWHHIDTECVGSNPFGPMYPNYVRDNSTKTLYDYDYRGMNLGNYRAYNQTICPWEWGPSLRTSDCSTRTVQGSSLHCEYYELFDMSEKKGYELYITVGFLSAVLSSVFVFYLVKVFTLQTQFISGSNKVSNKSYFESFTDTFFKTPLKYVLAVTPYAIVQIGTPSDERNELIRMVKQQKIINNGQLVNLAQYLAEQGAISKRNEKYQLLHNNYIQAKEYEKEIRSQERKGTNDSFEMLIKNCGNVAKTIEHIHNVSCNALSNFPLNKGVSPYVSITNANNVKDQLSITNANNDIKNTAALIDNNNNEDEDENENDEEEKKLLKRLAQIAEEKKEQKKKGEKKEQKKKGGKNKTKKNKNSKKTKKHLLKNNKHKSKRTKQ